MRITSSLFLAAFCLLAFVNVAHAEMPEPLIPECTDPPAEGVPDLRGVWQVTSIENFFHFVTEGLGRPKWQARLAESMRGSEKRVERIEQCGLKVAIGFRSGAIVVVADGETPSETEGYEDRNAFTAIGRYEDDTLVIVNDRDEGKIRIVRQIVDGKLIAQARPDERDDDFLPLITTYERLEWPADDLKTN